jgi:multiple sugar transport system ATP-binding protein/inositol-phosphate transport system ATP-binding protein
LEVTTIYVTHDQEEAMTIADRMAIFLDGNIVQVGTPEDVFNNPNTIDVAAFIGSPPMNLMPGRLEESTLVIGEHRVELSAVPAGVTGVVAAGIRPSHLQLTDEGGFTAKLLLSENLGESMLLNLRVGDDLLKMRLPEVQHFTEGETLHVSFDPAHVHLFDPDTRQRIS